MPILRIALFACVYFVVRRRAAPKPVLAFGYEIHIWNGAPYSYGSRFCNARVDDRCYNDEVISGTIQDEIAIQTVVRKAGDRNAVMLRKSASDASSGDFDIYGRNAYPPGIHGRILLKHMRSFARVDPQLSVGRIARSRIGNRYVLVCRAVSLAERCSSG